MIAAVIVFPGSNADQEMVTTLRDVVGIKTSIVWHTETRLPEGLDLAVLPGGFSYGDYLRSGAIAKVSPILAEVRAHAARGGLVLGVCNGFQILTEGGLLPGALTRNRHLRFECRDVLVRAENSGPFTSKTPPVMRLPIAHADGRYHAAPEMLTRLESEGLVGLRYVDAGGEPTDASNPNGSLNNIAGIYGGPKRNVFGLMPHPERMSEDIHGGTDGLAIFRSAVASLAGQA